MAWNQGKNSSNWAEKKKKVRKFEQTNKQKKAEISWKAKNFQVCYSHSSTPVWKYWSVQALCSLLDVKNIIYTLIAFNERVTFWLQLVGSLPCACAYVALFARRLTYNHYAIAHTCNAANAHAQGTDRAGEAKKLLSRWRQSEYRCMLFTSSNECLDWSKIRSCLWLKFGRLWYKKLLCSHNDPGCPVHKVGTTPLEYPTITLTQQNSYSISHLLGTVTTQRLLYHCDDIVTVL